MTDPTARPMRCAVYTRKSTEHNLDLAFTSLDAQREACEAYIRSQVGEGWWLVPEHFDDGGLSGPSRPRVLNPPPESQQVAGLKLTTRRPSEMQADALKRGFHSAFLLACDAGLLQVELALDSAAGFVGNSAITQ
jgi:hypothetical protein